MAYDFSKFKKHVSAGEELAEKRVHDPNGYGVELVYDLPREVWEGDLDAALNYAALLPTEGAEAMKDETNVPVFRATSATVE